MKSPGKNHLKEKSFSVNKKVQQIKRIIFNKEK